MAAATKEITRAELAEHNNNRSTWICIGNKVYDVTKFLDEHPGGCEVLLEQAGMDATESYEDVGHSTDAREMKENYLVAEIVDAEKKTYTNNTNQFATYNNELNEKNNGSFLDNVLYMSVFAVIAAIIYYFLSS